MTDLLGMTVADLVAALRGRRAPLPFEIGAFVALQVCESIQTGPAVVRATDVRIAEDGSVSVFAAAHSATDTEAAKAVVALLAQLLVAAGPGVPSTLLALVERGVPDLRHMRDELEATLVPLNRGASRRVLARLVREAGNAPRATGAASAPGGALLDDALDDLLGESRTEPGSVPAPVDELDELLARRASAVPPARVSTRPPPASVPPPSARPAPAADDPFVRAAARGEPLGAYVPASTPPPRPRVATPAPARAAGFATELSDPFVPVQSDGDTPTGRHPSQFPPRPERTQDVDLDSPSTQLDDGPLPKPARLPSMTGERVEPARAAESPLPAPKRARGAEPSASGRVSLDGFDDVGVRRGRPMLWLFVVVLLLGGLGGGIAWLRPDVIARLRGASDGLDEAVARQRAEHDRAQAELAARHAATFGDLVVRGTPERAQVLMFVGRGPVTVRDLPEGVAHEFVAIAEGKTPTRAVVPVDATWEATPEGARFELAIQVNETEMADSDLSLGETRLPHDVGTGNDALGTVRVITTPAGAKVYQLVGFTPDVRVSDVRVDEALEVLVWAEGFRLQRLVVGPSDWRLEDGHKVAELNVTLEPHSPSRHH